MGPVVALATAAGLILYIVLFLALLEFLTSMTLEYKHTKSVIVKLLLLIPIIVFGLLFVVLDIIHTLLCIWFGYQVLHGLRSWWHQTK